MNSVAKELGIIDDYNCYEEIPPAKKAWITMKARERGFDPKMVHAGIKAYYKKIYNALTR